ncbi:MAG: VanW family protein [Candidatus Kerfeldbacteria bacterium]|nr:VanW family protein [Candidatus Kerfeldbacteria bacterium]
MMKIEKEIAERIYNYENPKKIALSRKYPFLKKPIIFLRHLFRDIQNFFDFRIKYERKNDFFDCIIARHQSVLRRKLGDSNPKLQEQKIVNLKQAIQRLNGIVIQPNHVFSLWNIIGKPKYENGYVDGMLLSNGKVVEGIGGGLCQLSNFLYWIFLHAPIETTERYHHSMDVFPDSGRTLPFGGGATILYNFIDLKVKNISIYPFQLKIWLTDNHLKGQILSPRPIAQKFHIFEKNHFFVKRGKKYFRYNEIYKETKIGGKVEKIEKITTNFAPALYKVTDEYLQKNNFRILDFTNREIKILNKE